MSQGTFSPYLPEPAPQSPANNGLAIAGFVVSILGIITCGVLAPIGLLLSLIGLVRPPRGFAVAGVVVGLLGCLLLSLVGYGVVMGVLGVKKFGESIGEEFSTAANMSLASHKISEYRMEKNELPSDADGQALIAEFKDGWNNGLHYKRLTDETYEIRSSGGDGQFHTADDRTDDGSSGADFSDAMEDIDGAKIDLDVAPEEE